MRGSEFAGRLDFNQYTEGEITPPCAAWTSTSTLSNIIAPISCLKSKAPRHKEMDVYVQ